jgi:hypothetical protein
MKEGSLLCIVLTAVEELVDEKPPQAIVAP